MHSLLVSLSNGWERFEDCAGVPSPSVAPQEKAGATIVELKL